MVGNALIDALIFVLDAVYSILPNWTVDIWQIQGQADGSFNDYSGTAIGGMSPFEAMLVYMRKLNWLFPFDQLSAIVSLFVLVYGAILGIRAVKFIINVVRGAGAQ